MGRGVRHLASDAFAHLFGTRRGLRSEQEQERMKARIGSADYVLRAQTIVARAVEGIWPEPKIQRREIRGCMWLSLHRKPLDDLVQWESSVIAEAGYNDPQSLSGLGLVRYRPEEEDVALLALARAEGHTRSSIKRLAERLAEEQEAYDVAAV